MSESGEKEMMNKRQKEIKSRFDHGQERERTWKHDVGGGGGRPQNLRRLHRLLNPRLTILCKHSRTPRSDGWFSRKFSSPISILIEKEPVKEHFHRSELLKSSSFKSTGPSGVQGVLRAFKDPLIVTLLQLSSAKKWAHHWAAPRKHCAHRPGRKRPPNSP